MEINKAPSGAAYRKREAILQAAKAMFLQEGYEASLDRIAEAAGVARRTIFNNFDSKEQLLAEIVDEMSAASVPQLVPDATKGMGEALQEFAESYVESVTSSDSAMLYRMLLSGAPNLLENMKLVLERNYGEIVHALANDFRARIAAGSMKMVNPEFAAERFLTSVLGFARTQLMLGMKPDFEARRSYIRDAVIGFIHGVELPQP